MRRRRVVGVIALVAAVAALTAGPAYAKEPKPFGSMEATPTALPSKGTTTLMIRVGGPAKECALSANEPSGQRVAGLPVTFPCQEGTIERKVTMPANRTQGVLKYKLYFRAFNAEHRGSHKVKVKISVESETFTVAMLQRSLGETAFTEHNVRGMAPLTVEYEVVLSNIGEEVPVQVDSIQDLPVPGCTTTAPKQREVARGELGVVEATCSTTIFTPQESFRNVAVVRGKFFPPCTHHKAEFFEVERELEAETE
jgi:hypothetical protein